MCAKVINWGIVSAGKISHDFCVALTSMNLKQHKVVCVAARNQKSAESFAAKHKIPIALDSYEDLAKCPEVDVAYVGVINPLHYDVVMMLLKHGKNVLCEKPLGMNYRQANEMCQYAQKKSLFIMEGLWSRFLPSYHYLRKQIHNGYLGDIKEINLSIGNNLVDQPRVVKNKLGGGVILDLGGYALQLSQMIFPDFPRKIEACGDINKDGCDEYVECLLYYARGRRSKIVLSAKEKLDNKAVISGTDGELVMNDFWSCMKLRDCDYEEKDWPLPQCRYPTNYHNTEGLGYEAEAVRKSLINSEKENRIVSINDSLTIAKMQDALRMKVGVKYDCD